MENALHFSVVAKQSERIAKSFSDNNGLRIELSANEIVNMVAIYTKTIAFLCDESRVLVK